MADEWYKTRFENRNDAVNDFLRSKETTGRSPRTLNEYSRTLHRFYHEHFPELTPAETEVRHIEEYLRILVDRDLTQNTKRKYLENLSAFFSWAMKRPRFKGITGNPAAVVLEEIPKQIRDRPDCATWENAKEVVHRIDDPRDKTVAILLAKTGCRVTEALSITEDDLLLDNGFIRLSNRKGGNQTVVPIDQETVKAVNRYRYIDQSKADTDYVFPSNRGTRLTRERIRKSVRKAAVETGVMEEGETRFHKKFTPHTFRTVFTTQMRKQGMSDYILQYIPETSEYEDGSVSMQFHPLVEDSNYLNEDHDAYNAWWHPLRFAEDHTEDTVEGFHESLDFRERKKSAASMFLGIATGPDSDIEAGSLTDIGITTQYLADFTDKLINWNKHDEYDAEFFEEIKNQAKVYNKLASQENENFVMYGTVDDPHVARVESDDIVGSIWNDQEGEFDDFDQYLEA